MSVGQQRYRRGIVKNVKYFTMKSWNKIVNVYSMHYSLNLNIVRATVQWEFPQRCCKLQHITPQADWTQLLIGRSKLDTIGWKNTTKLQLLETQPHNAHTLPSWLLNIQCMLVEICQLIFFPVLFHFIFTGFTLWHCSTYWICYAPMQHISQETLEGH